jgi:hypothetical protein
MVFYEFSYSILKFVYFQNVIFLLFFHTNFQLIFFTIVGTAKFFYLQIPRYENLW